MFYKIPLIHHKSHASPANPMTNYLLKAAAVANLFITSRIMSEMQKSKNSSARGPFNGQEDSLPELMQISQTLDLLPMGAFLCNRDGFIVAYNGEAARLWKRHPVTGNQGEQFDGAYKLYESNGAHLPHEETPTAWCLRDGLPRKDIEVLVQRSDDSCIHIRENVAPIKDENGSQVGVISCFYDITAQRNTEKQLQRTTMELRDYVENGNVGLHWVDANGIIKWANKAELQMLGYEEDEYIGHHIKEFHANAEIIGDILRRLGNNETLDQYESQLICKDRRLKTVHISSSVFREDNKFFHTRCFTIDVTEQKKLDQALKESEARYRQLVQTLDVPLYMTDDEGRITLYNKAAVDLWGRTPDIGKDYWCGSFKILKPDGSPLHLDDCPMATCLKQQRPIYGEEILVVRADGSYRHVAPHPQPVFDGAGRMTGAINMLQDITNVKSKEKALRDSEEKYRLLANSLEKKVAEKVAELKKTEDRYHRMIEDVEDYSIILLAKNGVIQNWNKGAEKITGYKEEDIVGRSFEEFYLAEDRENGLPLSLLAEALEKGKVLHEGWRKRADNTRFWGSTVLTTLHDDEGNPLGFSKVTRDLTERKAAEDKMKEYLTQLQFQNQELEQFVYAASHDLKEPLRKIHMYDTFISENPSNVLDPRSAEFLRRSINAAVGMKNLIEDLLTYSKATAKVESYEQVPLNKIVEEIIAFQKDELELKRVNINVGNLPTITGVSFQIKQLFTNLIDNGIKYKHPERDPVITINCETITGNGVSFERQEPFYKISVTDNGIGFDPQYATKIFDIFQRLDAGTNVKGSGIGLSICKKIVQNHNGLILAEGRPGEEASFIIYLPQYQPLIETETR